MQSGYLSSLTESEQQLLINFRNYTNEQQLSKDDFDDAYLLRFLRARKFDWSKTKLLWDKHIDWRRQKQMEILRKFQFNEIDHIRTYYPHGYQAQDKNGRPVYIERIGLLKYDKIFENTNEDRLVEYFTLGYENLVYNTLAGCSKQQGKTIEQTCVILGLCLINIDLSGGSVSMFNGKIKKLLQLASNIGNNYYPEMLGVMYIVNAPMLFSTIWSVIKLLFDERTQKKVQILGSGYKKELLKIIDADQLPIFLGGNAPDLLSQNKGPWNPLGLELFGSDQDVERKNTQIYIDNNLEVPKNLLLQFPEIKTPSLKSNYIEQKEIQNVQLDDLDNVQKEIQNVQLDDQDNGNLYLYKVQKEIEQQQE